MVSRSGCALFFLLACTGATLLRAQENGTLHLVVKDPSGAAVQASGALRNLDNGVERAFQTNSLGSADFTNLHYGRYQIRISKGGFSPQAVAVDVPSATPVERTIILTLSSQATSVNVVSVAPLPGTMTLKDDVAMNVQTASGKDIDNSGALDLSDFMNRSLGGVYVNNNQENPFQPDLNYRGYTASPLLGTPEGMSVYVDGVRQNQPFGDVVAWDLIPKIAIEEMALVPGSDPVFGLNTLGAAVTVRTKDGRSAPGTSLSVDGGSFGRRSGTIEHGGSNSKGLNWYFAGNWYREDGWRLVLAVRGPADLRQSRLRRRKDKHFARVLIRGQLPHGKWVHGYALPRQELPRGEHNSRYHLEPFARAHTQREPQREQPFHALRRGLCALRPCRYHQRRSQQRFVHRIALQFERRGHCRD